MGSSSEPTCLSEAEAAARAADLDGWDLDYPHLRRLDVCADFQAALTWINRVGALAEECGHHPDIHLTAWNRVELVLSTHDLGGLSEADFDLARRIEAAAPG